MIYFDNVTKLYSDHAAVSDVTFGIESGEFLSIVGHSGAGKTSLLRLLLVEDRPTSGAVFFEKTDIHRIKAAHVPEYRRRIGTVFQDFRLFPNKTAYENIAFALEAAGRTDEEIRSDVPQVLELVDLASKALHFPHELSGGEKQRVAIARAIISQPDVLIADEPTGNLDPVNTYDIIQILKKINDMGTTIILTTHNKGIIDALKKRVVTMENGKVIRDDAHGKYIL
ncbi:MAG: cell division ATP-binding protein FtsE [Candidatus Lloydbacteria bacterium RIFCSPHIGHO2_01_FULL_49_22]|uniref:Cell division ATP-binding protein FtsE n=1 Tax=Candidatus Lloydbacteria bacterium RIFCSPHIGHO2_01_FULL_49_22 TaxID=1798658 RepID=A0A1G2CXG1_9BACT|nr:MAG: cell division ATP-binding protein FtsE [Candidatus Lloydbacteria bacterium RIFCSPHIGHO2_01_FULL_49_22]OGZ09964.1 MAG: cell division ATP-binding protein FtsE [Candidatus Lloydbacteria bacterium RIFCSPHIGHO2_02_FULL_50_18]